MEKYEITEGMVYGAEFFDSEGIKQLDYVPFSECDQFAKELAQSCVVLDPDGVSYEAPDKLVHENFLTLKYFTNADVSQWTDYDGKLALFDFCKKNNIAVHNTSLHRAQEIYESYFAAMSVKHRHVSSLSYKIGKTFESFLSGEDFIEALAKSPEINEQLIDMLAILHREKEEKEEKTQGVGGIPMRLFAKK